MAIVETTYDENENPVFTVDPDGDTKITLATANTYVDKNIIINILTDGDNNNNNLKADVATLEETLAFLNIEIPDLTEEEF